MRKWGLLGQWLLLQLRYMPNRRYIDIVALGVRYIPYGMYQESSLVLRLVTLGLQEGGISQSELKLQLGIAQPRLSKLMRKLIKVGWIEVKSSKMDGRIGLMTTTGKAQGKMAALKADLAPLLRDRGVRRALEHFH